MPELVAPGPGRGDEFVDLPLGPYRIRVGTSFGPRVQGLRLGEGPEMFASLAEDIVIDRPDSGVYRFRGGHRLWASPEVPLITYAPDDEPCQVETGPDSVSITGPIDRARLAKRIYIGHAEGKLVVDHTLTNAGAEPLAVAPWALSQCRLGGIAIIPVGGGLSLEGLQADRSLVLWPYSDLTDPRLSWRRSALVIDTRAGVAFKVGTGPNPGRLGYLLHGHLFTKEIPPAGDGEYPDRAAVAQFFSNDQFCELESVGELVGLQPGEETSHRETWLIEPCDDVQTAEQQVTEPETP